MRVEFETGSEYKSHRVCIEAEHVVSVEEDDNDECTISLQGGIVHVVAATFEEVMEALGWRPVRRVRPTSKKEETSG